jgi:hypothetical protein
MKSTDRTGHVVVIATLPCPGVTEGFAFVDPRILAERTKAIP